MEKHKENVFYNNLNEVIKYMLAIIMMLITALTFYQVVMRYVFKMAPFWSEELVRFLFVWVSFIAVAIGIKEKIHIGIDALVNLFPQQLKKVFSILVYLLISIFGGLIAYFGWPVVGMTHGQPSPALGIPMSYVYISLPIMGLLIIFYSLYEVAGILKNS